MTGSAQPELDFGSLIGELAALRTGPLKGQPSARTLAKAANFSPTTICNWLRAGQFPQEIDPLLAVVRAVRLQAEAVGLADAPATVAVLDEQQWRRAFQAEARRRAQGTSAAVEAAQSRSVLERIQPGLPLQEVTDPFHLEVKRAIEAPRASQPPLPAYVPREHDQALATVVDQAADGENGLVVLVGESSTGKTRALWEALNRLRTRDEPWRLWHPIDRQRPTTPLTELTHLPPYTVVWLNEAQLYLDSRSGEQIASGLRTRLRDAQRAPVLVLATLWTEHWNTLTTRPPGAADVHSQARELLNGRRITVPSTFAGADLAALAGARGDDPRLGEAADHARDGHVIQYLAGGPVLLDRYRDAPPTTRALIDTAMDARRLGAGPHIPSAWLAHAAPGYLTESEWEHRSDDWFEQALAYVTTRHNGISAILTPVKTSSPRNQRATGRMSTTSSSGAGHRPQAGQDPLYRLADYLDQYGRHHRAEQIPPVDFWTAAAAYAHPTDLPVLGDAARRRGLYRDAAQLYKHATTYGNAAAAIALIKQMHLSHAGISDAYDYAATHAGLDDPNDLAELLDALREVGARRQVGVLLDRDPAAHANLGDSAGVSGLLDVLREVGAQGQVEVLLDRGPAAHANLDNRRAVAWLLHSLREVGAQDQVSVLAERAITHTRLDDLYTMSRRLETLIKVGAQEQMTKLAERAAMQANLDDLQLVVGLLGLFDRAGARGQVEVLLDRDPAAHANLGDSAGVAGLLDELDKVGARGQVEVLLDRDPAAHANLGDSAGVAGLLDELDKVGAQGQVEVLLDRDPAAHANLDNLDRVAVLLRTLHEVGAQEQATKLAERIAARVDFDDPGGVGRLVRSLHGVGAQGQVEVLLERDPATHANLDDSAGVAWLLRTLHEVGAQEQATKLAERIAARVALEDPDRVAGLLNALDEVGAQGQVEALLDRDPATHTNLNGSAGVAWLIETLDKVGAREQVEVLLDRDPATHTNLDRRHVAAGLLDALRGAGAQEQAQALIARLPAAGHFGTFLEADVMQERFSFGREPNGDSAAPWRWEDLE